MSTTNVRVQEAQYKTAQLLQYIINRAVNMAKGLKEANGNPYKVKLSIRDTIKGFTSENFTTVMTTKRYFDNLENNRQEPFSVNHIKDELTLNPDKQRVQIQIGSNLVRMPEDPSAQPKQGSEEMTLVSGKDYLERKTKGEPLEHTHKTGKKEK
jgi:hypothetical protein